MILQELTVPPRAQIISTEETYPLRLEVLRPGGNLADVQFPHDSLSTTSHWGVKIPERPELGCVAIGTIQRDRRPPSFAGDPSPEVWRLRGMASHPQMRRQGYARAVILAIEDWILTHCPPDEHALWFNARTGALPFYKNLGYQSIGEEFEIAPIGPHWVMTRTLTPRP